VTGPPGFESLDYIYTPSHDVAADVRQFGHIPGGRVVFAIEAMGTRVAMIELGDGQPRIVLTDHLEDDRPILVYRVASLTDAVGELEAGGWKPDRALEMPQGPCSTFHAPGGPRIAVYERTRPEVEASFVGRRDF
jgi:hypothetical protein